MFDPPTSPYTCLYEFDLDSACANSITGVANSAAFSLSSTQILTTVHDFFFVYSSPYSGAFDLLDTTYIPRACASQSYNMT